MEEEAGPTARLRAAIGRRRCRSRWKRRRRGAGLGPGNSLGAGRQPGWGRGGVGRWRRRRGAEGGRARVGAALRRVASQGGPWAPPPASGRGRGLAQGGGGSLGVRPRWRSEGWGEAGTQPHRPARTRSLGRRPGRATGPRQVPKPSQSTRSPVDCVLLRGRVPGNRERGAGSRAGPPVCKPSTVNPLWFHFLPEPSCDFLFFLCCWQRFKWIPAYVDFGILSVLSDRKLIQTSSPNWDIHVLELL